MEYIILTINGCQLHLIWLKIRCILFNSRLLFCLWFVRFSTFLRFFLCFTLFLQCFWSLYSLFLALRLAFIGFLDVVEEKCKNISMRNRVWYFVCALGIYPYRVCRFPKFKSATGLNEIKNQSIESSNKKICWKVLASKIFKRARMTHFWWNLETSLHRLYLWPNPIFQKIPISIHPNIQVHFLHIYT